MPRCMICGSRPATGFIVCGDCASEMTDAGIPPETMLFIDRLVESIFQTTTGHHCDLCGRGCLCWVEGMNCRKGVKEWLTDRAREYINAEKSA